MDLGRFQQSGCLPFIKMTFDDLLMFLILSTNDDMDTNIILLAKVISPLRKLYNGLDTEILLSVSIKQEYQIRIIEHKNSFCHTHIFSHKNLPHIWKRIMKLVRQYAAAHQCTYYIEKYFDLSELLD